MDKSQVLDPILVADVTAVRQRDEVVDGRGGRMVGFPDRRIESGQTEAAGRPVALFELGDDGCPRLTVEAPKAPHSIVYPDGPDLSFSAKNPAFLRDPSRRVNAKCGGRYPPSPPVWV